MAEGVESLALRLLVGYDQVALRESGGGGALVST